MILYHCKNRWKHFNVCGGSPWCFPTVVVPDGHGWKFQASSPATNSLGPPLMTSHFLMVYYILPKVRA